MLFYKRSVNEGLFASTDGSGNITTLAQHTDWDPDWHLIVPGNFGGSSHTGLLFYKRSVGEGLFVSTDGSGNITTLAQHTDWDSGFDLIVPGNFSGSGFTDLLFYRRSVGEGLFVSTDGSGNITTLAQHTDWDPGFDLIVSPATLAGAASRICCSIDGLSVRGCSSALTAAETSQGARQHTDWDPGFDLIVPGNFSGSGFTDLLY